MGANTRLPLHNGNEGTIRRLGELFESLNLNGKLETAVKLCQKKGADSILTSPLHWAGHLVTGSSTGFPKTDDEKDHDHHLPHVAASGACGADSNLVAWLKKIGIGESDVPTIMEQFSKPEYGVSTLAELFALDDGDVDEVLGNLPLAKRKLLKKAIAREK